MKSFIVWLGCLSIIIGCTNIANAQLFSSDHAMETIVSDDTLIISIGEMDFQGSLYGYKDDTLFESVEGFLDIPIISSYINSSLFENLHLFPLTGTVTLEKIDEITILPVSILETNSIDDLSTIVSQIMIYNDVTVSITDGFSLMGTSGEKIDVSLQSPSMISGFSPLPLEESIIIQSFISISEKETSASYTYHGNDLIIYPFSQDVNISVLSSSGLELWNNTIEDGFIILQDADFTFSDTSSLHIFPFHDADQDSLFTLEITPSEKSPDLSSILDQLTQLGSGFEDFDLSLLPIDVENTSLLDSVSQIINGGLVFINISKNVVIDDSLHHMEPFGFLRMNKATVHMDSLSSGVLQINGDFSLIFLGSHFYSSQAASSNTGFSIPYLPIILWILAISCFVWFNIYYQKNDIKYIIHDAYLKIGCILFHFLSMVLVFFLIDTEVGYQFGNSFFSEIFSNGLSLVGLIFGGIQLLFWIIGFLGFALPLGFIASKVLQYFGFDKSYKHFGKGAVLYVIWPVTAIYATLFVNLLLLFFNPLQSFI